jgi:hypothetical protein
MDGAWVGPLHRIQWAGGHRRLISPRAANGPGGGIRLPDRGVADRYSRGDDTPALWPNDVVPTTLPDVSWRHPMPPDATPMSSRRGFAGAHTCCAQALPEPLLCAVVMAAWS